MSQEDLTSLSDVHPKHGHPEAPRAVLAAPRPVTHGLCWCPVEDEEETKVTEDITWPTNHSYPGRSLLWVKV